MIYFHLTNHNHDLLTFGCNPLTFGHNPLDLQAVRIYVRAMERFLTYTDFAALAGSSQPTISGAVKQGKLTRRIDRYGAPVIDRLAQDSRYYLSARQFAGASRR